MIEVSDAWKAVQKQTLLPETLIEITYTPDDREIQTFTKSDLMNYQHKQSVDLLSATLPSSEVVFSLRNDDHRWNPDNPTGPTQGLLEKQEIVVRYGLNLDGGVEWIKGGTFWLSEWDTPTNGMEASFTARDLFSFMDIVYGGIRSGTLYEVAIAALREADLPLMEDGSVRYIVHTSLQNYTTDFSANTQEFSIAEILQMVANAGGCVLYQDRDGIVHLEPRSTMYRGYVLDPKVSYNHPEYTINKPLKAVSVSYGDNLREELLVDAKGEVQTVDNPLVTTRDDAVRVAEGVKELLLNRKVVSGDFRADLRIDALDNIIVASKYASNVIALTEVIYSNTGGAFKGTYTGRVVSVELNNNAYFSGDLYAGEV